MNDLKGIASFIRHKVSDELNWRILSDLFLDINKPELSNEVLNILSVSPLSFHSIESYLEDNIQNKNLVNLVKCIGLEVRLDLTEKQIRHAEIRKERLKTKENLLQELELTKQKED